MSHLISAVLALSLISANAVIQRKKGDPQAGNPVIEVPASASEKNGQVSDALSRMKDGLRAALGKLQEAESSKDVMKLNCVNDKLTQIKGLLRISENAELQMQEAVTRGNDNKANHEYSKIMIASRKVNTLRNDLEKCMGTSAFKSDDDLKVEVKVPADLPKKDTTSPGTTPPPVIQQPPTTDTGTTTTP